MNHTNDQNPDFIDDIYIEGIYVGRQWSYMDDIEIGIASDDYSIDRDISVRVSQL